MCAGNSITVGSERFRAPEVLFDPSLVGLEAKGIHHLVHDTINKCDIDVRRELYNNIVLSGGTSMFDGIQTRWVKRVWQGWVQAGEASSISAQKRQWRARSSMSGQVN